MAITLRRNPAPTTPLVQDAADLPQFVRRFFQEPLFSSAFAMPATGWTPAVDISEKNGELLLTAELPGLGEKDFEVSIENDVLTLSGEKKEEREEKDDETRFHTYERFYGAFRRSFALPRSVDAEKITAEFARGILMVHMPKTSKAKGRHIDVATR